MQRAHSQPYVSVQLAYKAGEVVVLEGFGEQIPGKLSWLPYNKAAAGTS